VTKPDARGVALRTLLRIDTEGAYANLALRHELDRGGLTPRDRAFATELVYGTTRLRRRLDHVIERFLLREIDPPVRAALRLGAYQLHELGTPPHAAVSATVEAVTDRRVRGFVNAVLRKVAGSPVRRDAWPSEAVRLSYPDWIVERLTADLGAAPAAAALEAMNDAATATEREDGYTQDLASQWVADLVGAQPGDRVADLCSAPGGKATAIATSGARVLAADHTANRIGLVRGNAERVRSAPIDLLVADAAVPPLRPGSFDRVLLDAPCSGLGTLRRRADARWRITADAVARLAELQRRMLPAAADLVRPGGTLVYSVCTLTAAEGPDVAAAVGLDAVDPPGEPWSAWGSGAALLPQYAGTDGMFLARWTR
jgi:16S rRNA (cytosine967-C5)-methyltransferase